MALTQHAGAKSVPAKDPDQAGIRGWEFELAELGRPDPPQVRHLDRLRVSLDNGTVEKMEPNFFCGILVLDREDFVFDGDLQAELFADFTLQRGFERFAGFHLAAGKFPQTRQVNMIEALRDEDFPVIADDGRNNVDNHGVLRAALR